ncbi:MAG TPA: molecular chaperone DnaK, partial [Geobacterales bacterium]|nr:molecular chaperone DnaK [Geobacterales bacterium]
EIGDKVSETDRKAVESALAELKTAAAGDDASLISAKAEELTKVAMKLGEALYRQAGGGGADAGGGQAPGGGTTQGGGSAPSDGVVDAEFEEVKDDEGKKKSA